MTRVVICDDHPVVRAGLRAVLAHADGLDVIGEAASADEAVALAPGADVVTMDLRLGEGGDGVDATARIRALPSPPTVLILTNYDTDNHILTAIEAGACGYLLKDAPPERLVRAVQRAAAGENVMDADILERLVGTLRAPRIHLTPREADVLAQLATGATNQTIGERLHLSPTTVKSHLAAIYGKLGVSSRTAAVSRARDQGLLD
ncbi:response regulator [Gulosibacter sp. ACHW.36C]|uniref:Response regulator transcription factor n=1 Tax=Gulosibacter sediminis TaxID=1729695 RepID=A0ABY4N0E8_9MICO|nr:response regulator transcription factor [Gulosibacter sediminis]UQN15509.1 response regulator transcription factor [Gulosibacter sediminis]